MDISQTIAQLKKEPGFNDNVGMLLIHNGVVRSWSRQDRAKVSQIQVTPDLDKIEEIRKHFEQRPGIFRIVVETNEGLLKPGDDLLFIIVAGDIRENVKPVLSDILDTIKKEAITKKEM
ncbi:MAG: molybdenum cofactor biosynthesis protein [Desulfonatronovibrio sp. MSAO_Bac4]|nr:MAG: molybdenum cofactor biosynthesis protein [Desulfonatronovibrio sp. MSAO_Bac4]